LAALFPLFRPRLPALLPHLPFAPCSKHPLLTTHHRRPRLPRPLHGAQKRCAPP
jgi:hypothetical protein